MPKRKQPQHIEKLQHTFRGRKIEIHKDHKETKIFIDDQEIEVEQGENGFITHAMMFKEYGSPYELAEDLIRQWGEEPIRGAKSPPQTPHH